MNRKPKLPLIDMLAVAGSPVRSPARSPAHSPTHSPRVRTVRTALAHARSPSDAGSAVARSPGLRSIRSAAWQMRSPLSEPDRLALKFKNTDYFELARTLRAHVRPRDRMVALRIHRNVVMSSEVVDYLLAANIAEDEGEGVFLGNELVLAGHLYAVDEERFADCDFPLKPVPYRFAADDCVASPTHSVARLSDLKARLYAEVPRETCASGKPNRDMVSGHACVTWLCESKLARSRDEALSISQNLVAEGFLKDASVLTAAGAFTEDASYRISMARTFTPNTRDMGTRIRLSRFGSNFSSKSSSDVTR